MNKMKLVSCLLLFALAGLLYAETLSELQVRANAGNADAQLELGVKYYYGEGLEKMSHRLNTGSKKPQNRG